MLVEPNIRHGHEMSLGIRCLCAIAVKSSGNRQKKSANVSIRKFGLDLPEYVEARVWDGTAELRYLLLAERPAGTGAWQRYQFDKNHRDREEYLRLLKQF